MYKSTSIPKRKSTFTLDTKFNDDIEAVRNAWKRSTDSQFICGLPGKEYEVWTNVSLRMGVLDLLREGRGMHGSSDSSQLALGKHIYKALPWAVARAICSLDWTPAEILQNAERAELEFATAGIESCHILAVGAEVLASPIKLFDCVMGSAATESSVAFLSDIHKNDLSQRQLVLTHQTPYGLTNLQDGQILESMEVFGRTPKTY